MEKSAKDRAFDRERVKLQRQRREAEDLNAQLRREIRTLEEKVRGLEHAIAEKDDWIARLLEYTELSKEDLKRSIEKDKSMKKAADMFNTLVGMTIHY